MIAGLRALRTYFTALGAALPTANGSKHGQVNIKQASVTEDEAYIVLRDSSGTLQYRRLVTTTLGSTLYGVPLVVQEGGVTTDATVGVLNFDASDFTLTEAPEDTVAVALAYGTSAGTPAEGNHAHALDDLSDVVIASAAQGQVIAHDGTDWDNRSHYTFTLGPYFINDLPGTATTQMTLGVFDTATTVARTTNDPRMRQAGRVVGLVILSDAARLTGDATARVRITGSGTTFNSGAVALDGTNTITDSAFVAHTSGVAFVSGNALGMDIVTSSWTPTTANLTGWLVVSLDPF
jgi:hypothetical protein